MTTIFVNKRLHKSFVLLNDGIDEFELLKRSFPLKSIKLLWNDIPQKRYTYTPPTSLVEAHLSKVKRLMEQQAVGTVPAYYQMRRDGNGNGVCPA